MEAIADQATSDYSVPYDVGEMRTNKLWRV